jgi:hypothetical protein
MSQVTAKQLRLSLSLSLSEAFEDLAEREGI